MSYISDALTKLNSRYTEVTDLIPSKYYFSDDYDASSGPYYFGIEGGGDDMYDGGNYFDTNLTQAWADVQDNNGNPTGSIPVTHTPANAEGSDDYTSPPMDGVVSSGSAYFGPGSEYFTNMYPALWVMMADGVSVDEFSVWGNLGADGSGSNYGTEVPLLGGAYTMFYKSVYDSGDTSINHIIILPGSADGVSHSWSEGETRWDDHNVSGISGRSTVFFLVVGQADSLQLQVEDATAVAEKFLSIVGVPSAKPRLTAIFPVLTLRVLAYDPVAFASQSVPDENRQNVVNQLESRTISLPYVDRPLRHGEEVTLFGSQAIRAKGIIETMNSDGNAVVEVLYYGSSPSSGRTYSASLTTKPSFLGFHPTEHKNVLDTDYGFDGGGMWLVGDAGDPAYPVRTEFTVGGSQSVTVTVDFLYTSVDENCPDHTVAVFSAAVDPVFNWSTEDTRISFQVNCGNPELEGRSSSSGSGAGLSVGEEYRVVMTYSPTTGATAGVYGPLPGTGLVGSLMSVSDTLPAGPYRVGFDADLDSSLPDKAYFRNLTIVVS